MNQQKKAYLFALMTVGLWSTVASACKLSLKYLTAAELVFYANATSCIVLTGILAFQKKLHLLTTMTGRDWLRSIKLGMINPFLYYLILFAAYDLLPAQQASPINYTWAITLTLLSVPLLGQKISRKELLTITISYIGVLIISTRGDLLALHFESPRGVFLALLSTVFWALYWIANTRDKRDAVVGLAMNFFCALPMIGVYVLVTEGLRLPDIRGFLGAVYLGTFEMGLSFVMWLTAMKLTSNTARIANLIFLSPFLSLVFIHYLVGEEILRSTFIGLLFIIVGLGLQSRLKQEGRE
jgi:drug/metabolite transporter (DMT)-like permease